MIGTVIPSIYLFIYLSFIYMYIYIYIYFMTNKIYVVREHLAISIFNKYLVLEFWLGQETVYFEQAPP